MLELNKQTFEEEVIKASGYVLVDFWAPTCEPCKALMPEIVELSEVYGEQVKFCKLDTSQARRVALGQKVLGLPTISLYKDGVKVAEVTKDDASRNSVEEMIKSNL